MCCSSTDITSTRQCITPSELLWSVNIWTQGLILSIFLEKGSRAICFGTKRSWKRWLSAVFLLWAIYKPLAWLIEILSQQTSFLWRVARSRLSILESLKITSRRLMMVVQARWQPSEARLSILVLSFGKHMLKMEEIQDIVSVTFSNPMSIHVV